MASSAPKRHGHSHRRASCIGENIDDEDDGAIDAMVNANDCSKVERAPPTSIHYPQYQSHSCFLLTTAHKATTHTWAHTWARPLLFHRFVPFAPPRPLRPAFLTALAEPWTLSTHPPVL